MCLRERMVQKVSQVCQRVLPTCETLVCCFVERHALLSVRLKAEKTKRASYCTLTLTHLGPCQRQCTCDNGCLSSPHALTALHSQRSQLQDFSTERIPYFVIFADNCNHLLCVFFQVYNSANIIMSHNIHSTNLTSCTPLSCSLPLKQNKLLSQISSGITALTCASLLNKCFKRLSKRLITAVQVYRSVCNACYFFHVAL